MPAPSLSIYVIVAARAEASALPTPTPFKIEFTANMFEIELQNPLNKFTYRLFSKIVILN